MDEMKRMKWEDILGRKLDMETNVYVILSDSLDDECVIRGYIVGTEADALGYCIKHNGSVKYNYDAVEYRLAKNLLEEER